MRRVLITSLICLICSICSGCLYKGVKVVEGTDLAIGLNIPSTDGVLQLQLLNYLSGFRLGVAENCRLKLEYITSYTNSYFGVVTTDGVKKIKATVEPTETGEKEDLNGTHN